MHRCLKSFLLLLIRAGDFASFLLHHNLVSLKTDTYTFKELDKLFLEDVEIPAFTVSRKTNPTIKM
jgi:hypothetical protein